MPVSADVQAAISQRYAQLSSAVLNGDAAGEAAILAPHFHDSPSNTLASYEYDPLTVMVSSIAPKGKLLVVHAIYYGAHGRKIRTIDHWTQINGEWRLLDRT